MAAKGKGVSYIKPQTPSFIAQFKQNVGYKEGPDIETKLKEAKPDDIDDVDRDDEKPTVVLSDGVEQSEANAFLAKLEEDKITAQKEREREEENSKATESGKIVFRKPEKRKNKGEREGDDTKGSNKKPKKKSSMKKVKDRNLLSFGDEEEGDG